MHLSSIASLQSHRILFGTKTVAGHYDWDGTAHRGFKPEHKLEHQKLADFWVMNPHIKNFIVTALDPTQVKEHYEEYQASNSDFPFIDGIFTGSGTRYYKNPNKRLNFAEFVKEVLIPNKFDKSYSDWPSEKISDTLAWYFSTKGQRIEEKDWPMNLPAHKGNQCFIIPSKQHKTKVYYACIGTGQTVAIIVPYRVTDGKVLTGDDAKPLLKESLEEMEAFSKNAFNYVKRQIPRKDYQLKTFSSPTPNKSLVNVLMVNQKGVTKGTAVQRTVQQGHYAGVFTCGDSSGDRDMTIQPSYRNKKNVELPNHVIFMDTKNNRHEALKWMENNPKVLFVENPHDSLPTELKHPDSPNTLLAGIKTTLKLMGIKYNE